MSANSKGRGAALVWWPLLRNRIGRGTSSLSCVILLLSLCSEPQGFGQDVTPSSGQAPVRLLFAGSSSTYWNDLPGAVARSVSGKIAARPGRLVESELVGRSGDDIRVYLRPGFTGYQYGVRPGQTFLDKIRDEKFDVVSLQVVSVSSFFASAKGLT